MFIKELGIYIDYLKDRIEESKSAMNKKQEKYLSSFVSNLKEGVNYYHGVFSGLKDKFTDTKSRILNELDESKQTLDVLNSQIEKLKA